jgi:hypothetical protein
MKRLAPDKTECVDVTIRVAMSPEMIAILDGKPSGGLNQFYWEVFCMRNPLGKWEHAFQVIDVTKTEEVSE